MIDFPRLLRAILPVAALALLSGAAAPPEKPAAAPASSPRPNLVLITAEGLRSDRLGCYRKKEAAATPAIDSLAAEGRLFEQVLTGSVSSVPALAGLLTGRTPFQTGVWDDHYRNRLAPDVLTLAERLKKEGYRTAAFVASSRLAADRGLDQGFDIYQDGYLPSAIGSWRLVQRSGKNLIPAAKSWLEGAGGGPIFLWFHLIEPAVPAPPTQTDAPTDAVDAAYYAKRISQLDGFVGEIQSLLKERGQYEGSVVVLTSDHGMALGEHGEARAGVFLYETTVRVPLLIKMPSGDPRRGSRSAGLAGLIDLFPTLERLLGLSPTPGLPGRDLLASEPSAAGPYYSVALMGREMFGWSQVELIASGSRRLITGAATELYDVASDPRQEKDLGPSAPGDLRSLQQQRTRISGAAPLPPAHFQPGTGLPPEIASRLVGMGFTPPTPERARARALPDPRRFLNSMRMMEFGNSLVELLGPSAVMEVKDRLIREDPEGLFSRISVAQIDSAQKVATAQGIAEVEAFLKDSQKIYPLEAEIYHLLGHVASEKKKYAEDEIFLKAALALAPRYPAEISYDLACAYARQGKKEAAIPELRKAIRLGFRDSGHIASDPDLEELRKDAAVKRLLQEELPAPPSP